MDCSYSWRVKLTEYGYCITNKDITNMTKTDEHEHIHGTSRNNVLDFTLGLGLIFARDKGIPNQTIVKLIMYPIGLLGTLVI